MNHYDNITFEKFSRKKENSAHKEKETDKQHWRQERKNVRENKRYSGEI
nr:MAG TPA: hypothetical protein [Caudoviricetes sp.]